MLVVRISRAGVNKQRRVMADPRGVGNDRPVEIADPVLGAANFAQRPRIAGTSARQLHEGRASQRIDDTGELEDAAGCVVIPDAHHDQRTCGACR